MAGIFKAYDIRGIYGDTLTDELAYRIGRASAQFFERQTLVVGRDMRTSSDPLFTALARGLTEGGSDVIDIGLSSTPMDYFSIANYDFPGGIMITASHNPAKYNGFKFSKRNAYPISYETGINEIERIAMSGEFGKSDRVGKLVTKDTFHDYVKYVRTFKTTSKKLKIVVDTANGMEGYTLPAIFEKFPEVEIVPMFFELDGRFPNHEADPLKAENLIPLQAKVKETGADFGVSFDGDADRSMFVDNEGKAITADLMTAIIGADYVKKNPGAKIIYDLRSSRVVSETIEATGGTALMGRVGHSFIKAQMRREDAKFAGELAGHFYFKDNFFTDSGIIALMRVIDIVNSSGKKLSELVDPLRKYHSSGEVNSTVADADAKLAELRAKYSDGTLCEIDGIRIDYADWWFSVRKSNTEPLLRLIVEATTRESMDKKVAELIGLIRA